MENCAVLTELQPITKSKTWNTQPNYLTASNPTPFSIPHIEIQPKKKEKKKKKKKNWLYITLYSDS